jgi:CDP-paratose 2-epimerase
MRYQRVLITGGAGFVGANLGIWLKSRHPEITVIAADNLRRAGSETNLPRLREHGITFAHCDVRAAEDVLAVSDEVDFIIECSAEPSVQAGYGGAADYLLNTNLLGTIHCLEAARRTRADLIFLSTSRVYPIAALNSVSTAERETRFALVPDQTLPGISERGVSERFPLEGSRSLYGATKLSAELLLHEYGAMYGVRYIINRCGVLTGPGQMGKIEQGVFALWVAMHYFHGRLSYIGWGGGGKQVRDLLHVDDLAELIDAQMARMAELSGQTFNVGGGPDISLSLLETTRLCREITGNTIPIEPIAVTHPADLKLYISDTRRVMEATGWAPRHTVHGTLVSIFEWLREAEPQIRHLWLG